MARRLVTDQIARYSEAKTTRQPHESDWKVAAAHCRPRQYNSWLTDGPPALAGSSGTQSARRVAYDSTAARALPKYMAILERMCTPHNMKWQTLTASDANLRKSIYVRRYFDALNEKLFQKRYDPKARFISSASETYGSIGVYGTGPIYYGRRRKLIATDKPGFLYRSCSMRDVFMLLNDDGEIDTVFHRIYLNYRQFKQKFPDAPVPKCWVRVIGGPEPKENDYQEFFHVVEPRTDHDPEALDARRHPFVSSYVCVKEQVYIGEEEGFRSMPYLTPRAPMTEPNDPYALSPAVQVLGAMGTASAMKKTNLKLGQKSADPVLLSHDDGVLNGPLDLRPGANNYGAVDKQGRLLVHTLPTGDYTVSRDLLNDERSDINDMFFVVLFQILMETPEMTATEVMERMSEKASLVAPTMGRIDSEWLSPGLMREIDMMEEMGEMPPMPPELIEARGQYDIIHTSPMAKSMYAEEVSGFMRSVEMATNLVQATGDPSHLDHYNFEIAVPEISEHLAVPARWMNDDKKRKTLGEARKAQAEQEQLLKAAAPLASAAKTMTSMQEGAMQ